jgi:hypothetical protein
MAFGFPAYHEQELDLPYVITDEWIRRAGLAAGLGQLLAVTTPKGYGWRGHMTMSLASWGEEVTLTALAPQRLLVRSECAMPTQCLDWGRNEKNVKRVVAAVLYVVGLGPPPA